MTNRTKVVYVTFTLSCTEDADLADVVSELDYDINHPAIIETEMLDWRPGRTNDMDRVTLLNNILEADDAGEDQ